MSEEEKFESIVQEIKDIYLYLTQGEPTPDDEITAREKLIEKIKTLENLNVFQTESNKSLFEDTLNKLDSWDTLELWFIESKLPEFIKKIINITDEAPEFQLGEEIKESPTSRIHEDLESASIDINEIVGKVSEQFKDEINDLKHEIDGLKLELEKKDETLKQVSRMKVVKKITPKRDVKLPPPKIKIPVIKKPEVAPQIKAPAKPEAKKPMEKIGVKSMQQVQLKIEEELEKLKSSSLIEKEPIAEKEKIPKSNDLKPISKFQEPKIISKSIKDSESILDVIEESDKSTSKMISELPEKPESISKILSESERSSQLPEPPAFTAMPEKPKKNSVISEIIEIDVLEEEKDVPFAVKKPKFAEQPKEVETPKIIQKPRIKSVSVEEVETESIRSSGTDLFNVFSSVGDKSNEKVTIQKEIFEISPEKDKKKKKKEEKDLVVKSGAKPFVEFGESKPEKASFDDSEDYTIEDLPKDKDSLYQELIALEGKRYSLEKNFNEIEKVYSMGSINDSEYQRRSEDLRGKLDSITSRINNIRRVISSL
ncbi:MAG: hypothetical protein ACFFCV_05880 [Promethearchaeota archaeon]